jgi:asparagine synthase (glutamine-hydrolysing)
MCGIAGVVVNGAQPPTLDELGRMAAALRHRGPDGYGFYRDAACGLAHTRLSIIDLAGGAQPLTDEGRSLVVTFNGEIFNYRELRAELQAAGCRFRTSSDTEVLLHGWRTWGEAMLPKLNGDFAFALWEACDRRLILVRDRFGVRPLYVAEFPGGVAFASEAKGILATQRVRPVADVDGLLDAFLLWAPTAPRTAFRGVRQLPPGTMAEWRNGSLTVRSWYALDFPEARQEPADAIEQLEALLTSSVALRLRADVPVGAYLSGGLDSSVTSALAAEQLPHRLRTFSVRFDDPAYDEGEPQELMVRHIGSEHVVAQVGAQELVDSVATAVRHAETPLLRTAPIPMLHLARRVREARVPVVLSGEGADELFLGYDIFKETAVRAFCLRRPASTLRPRLLDRLYPWMGGGAGGVVWRRHFLEAGPADDPLFSHQPRFATTAAIAAFLSPSLRNALHEHSPVDRLRDGLPARFRDWSPLNRAAWLEFTTLLAPYLLASQGDRMAMAHGIEVRFPFLDHRLFEFAARLPTSSKLLGLREKEILRRWAASRLPSALGRRVKQPYRAPDATLFAAKRLPPWIDGIEDASGLREYFDESAVRGLVRRARGGQVRNVREQQLLVAVLTTVAWHQECLNWQVPKLLPAAEATLLLDATCEQPVLSTPTAP